MHMSTELPEFWNLRLRIKSGPRLHPNKTELPGVGTDLVPPSYRGGKDPSGGGEGGGCGVGGGRVPVEVDVLGPAGDGPRSALRTRAEVVIRDNHLLAGCGSHCGSLHCIHQILRGLNLSYQLGDLENNKISYLNVN